MAKLKPSHLTYMSLKFTREYIDFTVMRHENGLMITGHHRQDPTKYRVLLQYRSTESAATWELFRSAIADDTRYRLTVQDKIHTDPRDTDQRVFHDVSIMILDRQTYMHYGFGLAEVDDDMMRSDNVNNRMDPISSTNLIILWFMVFIVLLYAFKIIYYIAKLM